MVYPRSVLMDIISDENLLSNINIIYIYNIILYVRICVFFSFCGCVSHREGGEGQADASKAV